MMSNDFGYRTVVGDIHIDFGDGMSWTTGDTVTYWPDYITTTGGLINTDWTYNDNNFYWKDTPFTKDVKEYEYKELKKLIDIINKMDGLPRHKHEIADITGIEDPKPNPNKMSLDEYYADDLELD